MMDSMTNKELDSSDIKLWQTESRIMRIARGAGVHPNYVGELIGRSSLTASALPHRAGSTRGAQGVLQEALDGHWECLHGLAVQSGSAVHPLQR